MRNKIQAPDKQVLHKQVPKAQALQKEKDPRLVAVGGFGQVTNSISIISQHRYNVNYISLHPTPKVQRPPLSPHNPHSCKKVKKYQLEWYR